MPIRRRQIADDDEPFVPAAGLVEHHHTAQELEEHNEVLEALDTHSAATQLHGMQSHDVFFGEPSAMASSWEQYQVMQQGELDLDKIEEDARDNPD